MTKEAVFTVRLDPTLRDRFLAEAEAGHRPAEQLVREFMLDYIQRRQKERAHDRWFRAEVEQGMQEADDPATARIPHEEVRDSWRKKRAELAKRTAERS